MTTRNANILLVTALGGVVGGLLGCQFLDLGFWRSVGVVAGGTVFGVAVALGLLTADRRPVTRPRRTVPVAPDREPVFARAAEPEPAAANRTWWTEAPARPASGPADPAPTPPDDGHDVGRAVIAQCPRCGDFRLDLQQRADAYAFHCRNPRCGHRWEWRAGTPWPMTVIRRNLTG
ncbi:hypothetical protein LZG04_20505 [Saccharothrix sp. S26]|uniref:hypothetical protein n=1 Tax=Saccharothrix sp. S26 TaxID=2907215 RepID=UPI001F2C514C|nr:hypothetical protein [Saccharothrix sp. S26]MCE6997165.1 hypothetical protein [Saccharothrix sp. S26]